LRERISLARTSLPAELIEGYVDLWTSNGASHELTISLGIHPRTFDPETQFLPQLRRVTREIARGLGRVSKRRSMELTPEEAVWMAGFYEPSNSDGVLFPHWHGVIALQPGDEPPLRHVLSDCLGDDADNGRAGTSPLTRPVISLPKAKPTFHLAPLVTPHRYIAYATKKVRHSNVIHWTTHDFLPQF